MDAKICSQSGHFFVPLNLVSVRLLSSLGVKIRSKLVRFLAKNEHTTTHVSGRHIWTNFKAPQWYIPHFNPCEKSFHLRYLLDFLAEPFFRAGPNGPSPPTLFWQQNSANYSSIRISRIECYFRRHENHLLKCFEPIVHWTVGQSVCLVSWLFEQKQCYRKLYVQLLVANHYPFYWKEGRDLFSIGDRKKTMSKL